MPRSFEPCWRGGKYRAKAIILILSGGLGAALLGGGIGGAMKVFVFWPVLVSPLGLGVLIGLGVAWGIRAGSCSKLAVGTFSAVAMGLSGYCLAHYTSFWLLVLQMGSDSANKKLLEHVGRSGFVGHMMLVAQRGIQIGQTGWSRFALSFGTVGQTFYWILELVVVCVVAAAIARWETRSQAPPGTSAEVLLRIDILFSKEEGKA